MDTVRIVLDGGKEGGVGGRGGGYVPHLVGGDDHAVFTVQVDGHVVRAPAHVLGGLVHDGGVVLLEPVQLGEQVRGIPHLDAVALRCVKADAHGLGEIHGLDPNS